MYRLLIQRTPLYLGTQWSTYRTWYQLYCNTRAHDKLKHAPQKNYAPVISISRGGHTHNAQPAWRFRNISSRPFHGSIAGYLSRPSHGRIAWTCVETFPWTHRWARVETFSRTHRSACVLSLVEKISLEKNGQRTCVILSHVLCVRCQYITMNLNIETRWITY